MSCGGKPAQPIEKSMAGASRLAQIIARKFASYRLIDGATLSRTDWSAKALLAAAPQIP